jgi:hypothetical protein
MQEDAKRIENFLSSLFELNSNDFDKLEGVLLQGKASLSEDSEGVEEPSQVGSDLIHQNAEKIERIADLFFAAREENGSIPSWGQNGNGNELPLHVAQPDLPMLSVGTEEHALIPTPSSTQEEGEIIVLGPQDTKESGLPLGAPAIVGPLGHEPPEEEGEKIVISPSFDSLLSPFLIPVEREESALQLLKQEEERLRDTYQQPKTEHASDNDSFFASFSPISLVGPEDAALPVVVGEFSQDKLDGVSGDTEKKENKAFISQEILEDIKAVQQRSQESLPAARIEDLSYPVANGTHTSIQNPASNPLSFDDMEHVSDGVLTYSFEGQGGVAASGDRRAVGAHQHAAGGNASISQEVPVASVRPDRKPRHSKMTFSSDGIPVSEPLQEDANQSRPVRHPTGGNAAFEMMPPSPSEPLSIRNARQESHGDGFSAMVGSTTGDLPRYQSPSSQSNLAIPHHAQQPSSAHHVNVYQSPSGQQSAFQPMTNSFQNAQSAFVTGAHSGFQMAPPHAKLFQTGSSEHPQASYQQYSGQSSPFLTQQGPQVTGSFPVINTGMYQVVDGVPQPVYSPMQPGQWTSQGHILNGTSGTSRLFFALLGAALFMFVLIGLIWLGWFYDPLRGMRIQQTPRSGALPADTLSKVSISSRPKGAEIYIDGAATGQLTPATLQIKSGVYAVALVKKGFAKRSQKILVQLGKEARFTFTLQKTVPKVAKPTVGVVYISSTMKRATVWIDGKETKHKIPGFIKLPYGEHRIRLKLWGYWRGDKTVTVGEQPVRIRFPYKSKRKRRKKK